MGVYGGGDNGASERARQEAARQAEIERQRLADEAAASKAEAERRYQAEIDRHNAQLAQQKADAEEMRKTLEAQNAATLAAQQKIEADRKAERDADLARQEKLRADDIARQEAERKAAEEKATQNATTLSKYSTDRQGVIDSARSSVTSAFAPYDDNFFNKYATDYTDYYKPQIAQQYDDAKRATTFNFANKGSLNSTAAARAFGRLDQTRAQAEAETAQKAASAAAGFRGTVDQQRADLLNGIFNAASAAPPITVDNIGEANNSLRSLSTALTSPVSLAASAAGAIKPPVFASLTNPFGVTSTGASIRPTAGSTSSNGAYSSSGGSSGRLVN